MKPTRRAGLLAFLIVSLALPLSAQDGSPSLGDLARQERERRQKLAANAGQTDGDASELSVLTEATFKANILITESNAATEKWVLMSEPDRPSAGRIRQLARGKKYYLPFVVTDYPWLASDKMDLTTRVRFISPAGKTLLATAKWSETIAPDPRSPSVIVLNPVMDITFDPDDLPGTYTVRVTITDRVHSAYAKAEEQFQLVPCKTAEAKGPAAAAHAELP